MMIYFRPIFMIACILAALTGRLKGTLPLPRNLSQTQPIRIVNVYSDSVDMEWDFQHNFTEYMISNVNFLRAFKQFRNPVVKNNEITIRGLKPGEGYLSALFGLNRGKCEKHTEKAQTLLSKTFFGYNIPELFEYLENIPRQSIKEFVSEVIYKSNDNFFIQLTWKSIPDALTYRVRYHPLDNCNVNQREILTNETSISIFLLNSRDLGTGQITYLFNLRVNLSKKLSFLPKADPIQLLLDGSKLKEIKEAFHKQNTALNLNIPLFIGLSVTLLCFLVLVAGLCYEHRRGKIDVNVIKAMMRNVTTCQKRDSDNHLHTQSVNPHGPTRVVFNENIYT